MARYIVGRAYGWLEFADEGQDVWVIHVDEPVFFMRVIERPEAEVPSGEVEDLAFPIDTDPRFALGNLTFFEPVQADPRELATLVAGAIEAIHDEAIQRLIGIEERPLDPPPVTIWREDIPRGFVVGALYLADEDEIAASAAAGEIGGGRPQAHGEVVEDILWLAHIGMPPFLLQVADLNIDDVDNEDIWATVDSEHVLGNLEWLSSMSCDRDQLYSIAEDGAAIIRDIAEEGRGDER